MKKNVLIILLSIFVLSCNSDDDNSGTVTIESTLIAKGNLSGTGDEGIIKQNLEITNQNTWDDLKAQINSVNNISDNFSETDIDFSEYKIIAVFDKVKTNGSHSLDLNIIANSENIVVNVTDITPEGDVTHVITQPFLIVKILRSDLPIIFK